MQKTLFFFFLVLILTRSGWSYSLQYEPATTMPVFFGSLFIKIVFTVNRAYVNCFSFVEWVFAVRSEVPNRESLEGSEREAGVSAALCTLRLTIGAWGHKDSTCLNFLEKGISRKWGVDRILTKGIKWVSKHVFIGLITGLLLAMSGLVIREPAQIAVHLFISYR